MLSSRLSGLARVAAGDDVEERRPDRGRVGLQVRVEDARDRRDDVIGGHLTQDRSVAFDELHTGPELERVGQAIGRHRRHGLGESRHELRRVLSVGDELVVQHPGDRPRGGVVGERRVEMLDVAGPGDRQGAAAGARRRGRGRRLAGGSGRRPAGRSRDGHGRRGTWCVGRGRAATSGSDDGECRPECKQAAGAPRTSIHPVPPSLDCGGSPPPHLWP
jgi:hypothetical protein